MSDLRPADQVMRLETLGASHQTRLSFMRVLLRKMRRENWRFDRPVFEIDARGVGRAVYRAIGPRRSYSLIAFAHDLPDHLRSDRVIAQAWDATFALFDGTPTTADLDRLQAQVPLQEAGRVSDRELVLSRANRSTRLWAHMIERLSQGRQPDPALVEDIGYLMRTTAVYGSGKFGAADRLALADRPVMGGPFRAEMLAVWLIRSFAADLVEHMARVAGGAKAVPLAPGIRNRLGIGNSTGLGMAPFLVNHPGLLHAWISARETAIARVRALPDARPAAKAQLHSAILQAKSSLIHWTSKHPHQVAKKAALDADYDQLLTYLATHAWTRPRPWNALYLWAEQHLSVEGRESLAALMLEPHGAIVDDLADTMSVDEMAALRVQGQQMVADLCRKVTTHYAWALALNHDAPDQKARFWYTSEAKLEPRLGERATDQGAELEQPLHVARDAAALAATLAQLPEDMTISQVLAQHPEHRRMVRRVQITANAPYAEIRDTLTSETLLPIDMLRCKLAFFGATRFDPRSDRWLRITMYQNAPYPDDLTQAPEDAWSYGTFQDATMVPA